MQHLFCTHKGRVRSQTNVTTDYDSTIATNNICSQPWTTIDVDWNMNVNMTMNMNMTISMFMKHRGSLAFFTYKASKAGLSTPVVARRFKLSDSDPKAGERSVILEDPATKSDEGPSDEYKIILSAELQVSNSGLNLDSVAQGGIGIDSAATLSASSNTSSHPHTPMPDIFPIPKIPVHLQQSLEKVNVMSYKELKTQKFLDGDRKPFLSTKADGFLLRKNLIRDLPDEIHLFPGTDTFPGLAEDGTNAKDSEKSNKPDAKTTSSVYPDSTLEEISKIYEDLKKLDSDEAVYKKYFEKNGIKQDLTNELIQRFNGISDKFQLLRRNEAFQLPLLPNQYRYEPNLFNMPYNVPGFDVSFSGMPLRLGSQKYSKRELPVEMVKDLRMFEKSVQLRKGDLDFSNQDESKDYDYNDRSITIHPEVDTIGLVENVKLMEKDCIEIAHTLDDYRPFPVPTTNGQRHPNYSSATLLEFLITSFQRTLVKEIEEYLGGVYRSPDMTFKPNLFYLFEKKKPKILSLWNENGATEISLPIKLAKLSSFPLSAYNVKTRKEKRFLRLHLFKLYLLNLEGLIERLTTMKYQTQALKTKFLKNLVKRIYKEIDNELINQVIRDLNVRSKSLRRFSKPNQDVGVILYEPFANGNFKRMLWTKNGWGNIKHHQRSKLPTLQVRKVNIDDVLH